MEGDGQLGIVTAVVVAAAADSVSYWLGEVSALRRDERRNVSEELTRRGLYNQVGEELFGSSFSILNFDRVMRLAGSPRDVLGRAPNRESAPDPTAPSDADSLPKTEEKGGYREERIGLSPAVFRMWRFRVPQRDGVDTLTWGFGGPPRRYGRATGAGRGAVVWSESDQRGV